MGLCLSCHCGKSHPKSSLLPLSTPNHPSSSSPSLTTFLHLWTTDTTDTSSETTNKHSQYPLQTAPPVDDYSHLIIPHSSELFSLPSSYAGSVARSSTSSTSLSWSMENPKPNIQSTNQPMQPRGSNAARRKSCSSLGQQELLPEHWNKKSLADTIARLEKFCDVKFFLENRTSSQSWVVPRSNSDNDSTILVQESCRDIAQKLLWFANDHTDGMFLRCDGDAKCEVVVTNEQTESETVPAVEKSSRRDAENFHETVPAVEKSSRRDAENFHETVPEVANFPRDAENLESNVPLIASFLTDAENLQSNLDAGETPVMSRLPSLRFYDGEENIQFTDFEATFELLAAEMSALQCSVEADQPSSAASHCSFEVDQASGGSLCSFEADQPPRALISTENVAPGLGACQPAHRLSRTSSDLGGGRQFKVGFYPKTDTVWNDQISVDVAAILKWLQSKEKPISALKVALRMTFFEVLVEVDGLQGSQQKGPKNPTLFRSALSDISSNGTSADEPLGRKNHQPLKSQTSTGVLRRGGSRSLDLQNCSLSHLEFDQLLKSERWQLPQGAAETLCRGDSQRIESEESLRTEVADSATTEQLVGEEEGSAPSPSGDSAPSQGRVSVYGGGGEDERFPESVCTDDANGGDETPIIRDNSDKSLSQPFDNQFKLLPESPPGELASEDTSQLPCQELQQALWNSLLMEPQTAIEAAAECRPKRSCGK